MMMMIHRALLAIAVLAAGACGCINADPAKRLGSSMPAGTGFVVREVRTDAGVRKYSIFLPREYKPGTNMPAIVFLHGIGEAGNDGRKSTTVGIGPAIARRNGEFPFIVIFPQAGWDWTSESAGELVLAVLHDAESHYSIDTDRVTLTGMSSGGKGTWALGARYPQTWNALVPMGGYAYEQAVPALVAARMPIWALHNSGDFIVPVGSTRTMIKQLKAAGLDARYTEFSATGHNCWDAAYDQGELFVWLQEQRASSRR